MDVPRLQFPKTPGDLERLRFDDGIAAVMVPFPLLAHVTVTNDRRQESPRLARVRRSIRLRGFVPMRPIICRIGMRGRWVVVDGGHRLTAARQVAGEFWPNLWAPRVRDLYFLLFTTPGSWSKLRAVAGPAVDLPENPPPIPET